MKVCPKCKGTKFSVSVEALQVWHSDIDSWEDIEVVGESSSDDTYFCLGCESRYKSQEELEENE
jgi:hypothetical protein